MSHSHLQVVWLLRMALHHILPQVPNASVLPFIRLFMEAVAAVREPGEGLPPAGHMAPNTHSSSLAFCAPLSSVVCTMPFLLDCTLSAPFRGREVHSGPTLTLQPIQTAELTGILVAGY